MINSAVPEVAIIDYGMGNLFSVQQACKYVGLQAMITSQKLEVMNADAAILPGVGAFGNAMHNLRSLDMVSPIKDFINSGKPFMGICLGMQLLLSESEEFGHHKGLDIIKGSVIKFPIKDDINQRMKVPQVGWNQIFEPTEQDNHWDNSPLKGLDSGDFMYFVHSYFPSPAVSGVVLSLTSYEGIEYCSSIQCKNIFASQFHPEKSASKGIRIYKNWALIIKNTKRP